MCSADTRSGRAIHERNALHAASDTALMLAVSRRDEHALAELYDRYAGVVYGLARRMMWETAAAEEVVQEIFLRLWNATERFDPDRGSLKSFLLADCHGRAVDRIRSEASRRRREYRDFTEHPHVGDNVDEQAIEVMVADRVREAVKGLPEGERRAIELAYFGGASYREVAVMLGAPEGTVKSRIRSGLRRLRVDLADADSGAS